MVVITIIEKDKVYRTTDRDASTTLDALKNATEIDVKIGLEIKIRDEYCIYIDEKKVYLTDVYEKKIYYINKWCVRLLHQIKECPILFPLSGIVRVGSNNIYEFYCPILSQLLYVYNELIMIIPKGIKILHPCTILSRNSIASELEEQLLTLSEYEHTCSEIPSLLKGFPIIEKINDYYRHVLLARKSMERDYEYKIIKEK